MLMPEAAGTVTRPELSMQERQILALLAAGHTTETIARQIGCGERTVRRRVSVICARLDVRTTIEGVVAAVKHGII